MNKMIGFTLLRCSETLIALGVLLALPVQAKVRAQIVTLSMRYAF